MSYIKKIRHIIREPESLMKQQVLIKPVSLLKPEAIGQASQPRYLPFLSQHKDQFDFRSRLWDVEDDASPILVVWHCDDSNKNHITSYFADHKVAFVHKNEFWGTTKGKIVRLKKQFPQSELRFTSWGNRMPGGAESYAKRQKIDVTHLDDGFVHSFIIDGPHKPLSLAMDDAGIYHDTSKPSALENLLNHYDFAADKQLMKQAKAGIAVFNAANLSKHYSLTDQDDPGSFEREPHYAILVIGQPNNGDSLLKKASGENTDSALIKTAKKDHPKAGIYYRPHPQKGKKKIDGDALGCVVLEDDVPLGDALSAVDHVYTVTSIVGLEALLQGKKVTVFGQPFYAGWGLTDDRGKKLRRRKRELSIEELFAATYLLYPSYFHDITNEKTDFFEHASYFFIEKIKYKNIFEMGGHIVDLPALEKQQKHLSTPAKLLFYLLSTGDVGEADGDAVMKIATKDFHIRDFNQCSQLLIESSNYNALKLYCDHAIAHVSKHIDDYQHNLELLDQFFSAFAICLRNAHGRVIDSIPDFASTIVDPYIVTQESQSLFESYLCALSYNIQYNEIESLALALDEYADELKFNFWHRLTSIISQKPSRSERNHAKRNKILRQFAAHYRSALCDAYKSNFDLFINTALYAVTIDDDQMVINAYNTHLSQFEKNNYLFSFEVLKKYGSLIKRSGHFITILKYLLKKGHYEMAEEMLLTFDKNNNRPVIGMLWLEYHLAMGDFGRYIQKYSQLTKKERNFNLMSVRYARVLRNLGEFERAQEVLTDYRNKLKAPDKRKAIETEINRLNFINESSSILNAQPQPKVPKGVVFMATSKCYNTTAMMIPALVELKKKGYAIVNLDRGMAQNSATGLDYIDQFAGAIPHDLVFDSFAHDWKVDWDKREVSAAGINFYQGFYEGLSVASRTYYPDLNHAHVNTQFMNKLKHSDVCLSVCENIFREVTNRGIPTVFVTGNSHVPPSCIFRDFCQHKDHPLLTFINCNIAYENYFSNLGSKYSHTMCVTDMTLYPTIRAPFFARRDQFDAWYAKNKSNKNYQEQADKLIKVNRVSSKDNSTEQEVINYLKAEKKKGKKIICAFGKIPVDLNVPYDGGPAHSDMADWINHTVQACGESDDVILLVKPHPHELRPEIALDIIEGFTDLITVDIKDNVRILGHRDINVHALAPHLDLAILYNGSSSLELTAQGIPVMMAAYFGKFDYPVDLIYPESRAQYAQYLQGGNYKVPSEETRKRAAFLMAYMGTDEISILNDYSYRPVTNDKVGVPRWKHDKINSFLENGDPAMRLIADRMVEKFENPPKKTTTTTGSNVTLKEVA